MEKTNPRKLAELLPQTPSGLPMNQTMKTSSSSNNMGNQDCPFCMGLGFVKKDVPVEHPDFGKAVPCSCIEPKIKETRRQQMNALGALEMLNEMTFENFRSSGVALPAERQQTLRAAYDAARTFAVGEV